MKRWLWIALVIAGCKQGKNQRCQIASDCQDGLVCSAATGTCVDMTTEGIDALAPDGPAKRDAGVDAPRDAPPDI